MILKLDKYIVVDEYDHVFDQQWTECIHLQLIS